MRKRYDKEVDAETEADEVCRVLGETFNNGIPEELDEKLTTSLSNFQQDLEHHPYVRKLQAKSSTSVRKWPGPLLTANRLAWAAGGVFVLFLVVQSTLVGNAAPTWADIAAQFRSVESYNAVIYVRKDTFSEPQQYELWVNSAGRARMRAGTQVVFATEEGASRAFDLVNRRETEPGGTPVQMLRKRGLAGAFSLETLMQEICGNWVESTPEISTDAVISEDLAVFDVELSGGPNWVRVWAMHESRLPVRIRSYAPRDGGCIDVFFSYSKEQPDDFFDPDAFALKVQDTTLDNSSLAYAFQKDPGGRQVQLKNEESQVEAALLGLSYETHWDVVRRLGSRMREGKGMTREEVRSLCGEPDVIDSQGECEIWSYKLLSEDETAVINVFLTFDSEGKYTNHSSQRRILNPAVAKVSLSGSYWKNQIEPNLDRDLLQQDGKYGIAMIAKCDGTGNFIGGGHPWIEVEPGKEYLRQLIPGAYDFYIAVIDKQSHQVTQEILLREGVDLATGEWEVRFD